MVIAERVSAKARAELDENRAMNAGAVQRIGHEAQGAIEALRGENNRYDGQALQHIDRAWQRQSELIRKGISTALRASQYNYMVAEDYHNRPKSTGVKLPRIHVPFPRLLHIRGQTTKGDVTFGDMVCCQQRK